MAAAVHDPPVSVREKADRVTVVFNVSNGKTGTVRTEIQNGEDRSDPGQLFVAFSSVSPARRYEKRLQLPHCVLPTRIVSDIQSKCITVQLVKEDGNIVWGSAWVKEAKGSKSKGKKSPLARPASDPAPVSPKSCAVAPPAVVAEIAAVELDAADSVKPADDILSPVAASAESTEQKDADEAVVTEEPLDVNIAAELPIKTIRETSPKCLPEVAECAASAAASAGDGSAAADQKTPEDIARLPPKLRERLLQRGILKESEVAAAASLGPAAPVPQPTLPQAHVETSPPDKVEEDSPQASSSTAAKKKKNRRGRKQSTAAKGGESDGLEQEDGTSTVASTSKSAANATATSSGSLSKSNRDVPAPAATSTSTTSLAAAEHLQTKAVSKKTSKQTRENQLERQGKAKNGSHATSAIDASPDPDKGLPVLPPTDPEVTRFVQEALVTFAKDRKKATVLLRLAARKGYLTAYCVLAELAANAGDEALMIDALCSLLQEEEAKKQLLPDLLSKCALQLAAALRDKQHAEEVRRRKSQLQAIARDWPILLTVTDLPAHKLQNLQSSSSEAPSPPNQKASASQARESNPLPAAPLPTSTTASQARGTSKDGDIPWSMVVEAAVRAFASAGVSSPIASPSSDESMRMAEVPEQSTSEDVFDEMD